MPRPITLSPLKQRIYEFICEFKTDHNGNSPTIREIADAVGLASTSTANWHLDGLEKLGKITRSANESRMISVIGAEWIGPMTETVTVSTAHWVGAEI